MEQEENIQNLIGEFLLALISVPALIYLIITHT